MDRRPDGQAGRVAQDVADQDIGTTATNDRRGVVATLTDKGFELLERAAVDHVTAVRRVLVDVVEPGDWEALGRAMKAVLAVADSDT